MSGANPWTPEDIPDLSGKRALVTGVTSGIGEKTVIELARHGAEVDPRRAQPGQARGLDPDDREGGPGAALQPLSIDVSDLSSVRRAASQVDGALDLLINNAGVMATPYERTADGLELQMATNHFGPFALTGLLLPRLVASGNGRVVAVGSQASRVARRRSAGGPARSRPAATAGGVPTPGRSWRT